MAEHIVIERPNGKVTIVRSRLETASEDELTEHEQIINELHSKVKDLGLFSVSNQRELLIAYETRTNDNYRHIKSIELIEKQIEQYLSNL